MTEDFLSNYQHIIEEIKLVTSSGGAFEVRVNDELIFSKKSIHKRHAEPGEVINIFRKIIGDEVPTFPS